MSKKISETKSSRDLSGGFPRLAVFAMILLPFLCFAGEALAKKPSGKAVYEKHLNAARKLYGEKQYEKAIVEFEKAHAAFPDPKIYFNLAQAHRLLDHDPVALEYYKKFLEAIPSIAEFSPEQKEHFTTQVQKKIQEIEPRAKPVVEPTPEVEPVTPPAGVEPTPTPAPAPSPAYAPLTSRWWFWAGAGAAAVFTVGTVWAGMKSMSYNDDWEENRLVRDHDLAVKYQNMTDLFLLGAVTTGVGVGVVSYLYHKKYSSRIQGTASTVSLVPGFGPQGCMLTLSWDF